MDPTGASLVFGGVVALIQGVCLQLWPPPSRPWPRIGPRGYDLVQPRWCYWLGVGLIVAGIVW